MGPYTDELALQYAEALIRLLAAISEKSQYLPGEVDKYLVTAINSLRSADYVSRIYETNNFACSVCLLMPTGLRVRACPTHAMR